MGNLKSIYLGHLVPDRNRLDSIGMLQMEVNDLHAFQFVHTPFLVGDVDQFCGALIPIIGDGRKTVRKNTTFGGIGSTVSKKEQRNLIGNGSLQ